MQILCVFPVFLMFLDFLYLYLEVQWSLVSSNKTRARPDESEISGHDVFGYFLFFFCYVIHRRCKIIKFWTV